MANTSSWNGLARFSVTIIFHVSLFFRLHLISNDEIARNSNVILIIIAKHLLKTKIVRVHFSMNDAVFFLSFILYRRHSQCPLISCLWPRTVRIQTECFSSHMKWNKHNEQFDTIDVRSTMCFAQLITKALTHTSDDDRINISFAFYSLLLLIVLVGKIHKLSSPLKSQISRYSQFIRQFIKFFDEKTETHALIQKREGKKTIVHVSICMICECLIEPRFY